MNIVSKLKIGTIVEFNSVDYTLGIICKIAKNNEYRVNWISHNRIQTNCELHNLKIIALPTKLTKLIFL